MAFPNILLVSAATLLLISYSSGTPTLLQNSTTSAEVNKTALEGVSNHVLTLNETGNSSSLLNHAVQSSFVTCSSSSSCWNSAGYGSTCYNGLCVCDIGYHSNGLGRCIQTSCSYNYQCTTYQFNTRCNYLGKCVCDYGTYQNTISQTCKNSYTPSGGGGAGQAVGFSFGGFILLCIIIGLCVLCCRSRRQRVVRVVGPTAAGVVQQRTQPKPFVQPQPGYYQQPQQGYQQQPMPMPMPQPSAYPNPNYLQQQEAPPPPYNPAFAAPASAAGYPPINGKI